MDKDTREQGMALLVRHRATVQRLMATDAWDDEGLRKARVQMDKADARMRAFGERHGVVLDAGEMRVYSA